MIHTITFASPTNIKQKCWTLTPSGKTCMFIQSLVLRRCASTSSFGLPVNSGLKCEQFHWGIGAGRNWMCGRSYQLCRRYCIYTCGAGGTTGGITGGGWGAGCLPSAIVSYIGDCTTNKLHSKPNSNFELNL